MDLRKQKILMPTSLKIKKFLLPIKMKRVAETCKEKNGLEIKQLDMKEFDKELDKVKDVYNKAWVPNWGFIPMTEEI